MIISREDFKNMQDAAFVHDYSKDYVKVDGKFYLHIFFVKDRNGNLMVSVSGERKSKEGFGDGFKESDFCKLSYEEFIRNFYGYCGAKAPTEEQMTIWS